MAPDLEVNLSLLESTAGSLSMLIEEFTNASDIESSYEAAVGEKNLVGALHSFTSNWKAHREDMIKSMQDVYKMATQSHQAYLDTDDKLAQDIKADTSAAPPGAAPHPSPGTPAHAAGRPPVTPRPPDFEPLAGSDPVPGDPDRVAVIARRYRDTAAEIAQQAANLRTLSQQAAGGWKGKAGKVFSSHASDLADRISKAQGRYAATGDALNGWVRPLSDAQDEVYQAVWDAKAAQQQMTANAPPPPPKPGAPPPSPPTPDEQAAEKKRSTAYGQAQTDLGAARTKFNQAVGDYHTAAGTAAKKINDAIGHDGLKDSWWDRNYHWIKIVMEVIAVIVIVLAIAALLLACPFAAGFVLFGLAAETLATIAETALVVLTLVQLAYDSAAAATGKESWTAAILDVVSLCTFGFGKLAAPALKALADGGLDVGKMVSAGRAGRAFMEDNGLPGILYSLGSRSGFVKGAMSLFGKGPVIDGAISAASDAKTALTELVEDAKPTNLQSLWSWSKEAATEVDKLDILGGKLPDVARVSFRQALGKGLYIADGGVQWGGFVASGGYNAHAIVTDTFSDDGVGQTLADFRHMLSAVP